MLLKKISYQPATRSVEKPSSKELFTLRTLILLGLAAMCFFLSIFFANNVAASQPLYILLVISVVFSCLKILHEWYHYFFITVPDTPPHTKTYTVDIFTTFCAGEPYEMIVETLTAIQKITYQHTTYLCDEANDPYLVEVCKQLGVIHVTRTKKINAKAGNINNALKISTGELCAILDPDHVPTPDFLDPIVSHFDNPQIGYVQIVQAYKNENESLIAKGAAQQTYQFYGPIMMTMNKYGTVLAIGANCTFRRAALESIGGHAAGLAEDMNTAMHLHAKGWKSVYVPQILSLGLVPSTLSAYYKQQLKWSRGVFELLVTTFVKHFKDFTFLQKIHYGTIPLYYLSGIIFLINFLIPIVSLFTGSVAVKMSVSTFAFVGIPFVLLLVLIRLYVQKWVTKEEERGIHVVGGLIAIGTWWIFILGLVYTIIRKKIPYVPTPKDANESDNWPLHIPNIAVLIITVAAIIFGLYNDFNPYLLFMAGLALLNCLILAFNIAAGRQLAFRQYKKTRPVMHHTVAKVGSVKQKFWLLRRQLYSIARSYPVVLLTLLICLTSYSLYKKNQAYMPDIPQIKKDRFLLSGVFAPSGTNGQSDLQVVSRLSATQKNQFGIISLYIPWGEEPSVSGVPMAKLDSIYNMNAIPMISWEPWQNLFKNFPARSNDQFVFKNICSGQYDDYIIAFADSMKALRKPVYLRFAHEPDNPFYPWSPSGKNTPADFKSAWSYLHQVFRTRKADNVIWVWNIWKPEAAMAYFPGKKYVDWASVNILNYDVDTTGKPVWSFKDLYQPFRRSPIFRGTLPVMISEMGSLGKDDSKIAWLREGLQHFKDSFPEVKAYVLFYSAYDKNVPEYMVASHTLNWNFPLSNLTLPHKVPTHLVREAPPATDVLYRHQVKPATAYKGVNYNRTLNWNTNYYSMLKRDIVKDFAEIKQAGINTIKITSSGIYNRNVFSGAEAAKLDVLYSFWIPQYTDFIEDKIAAAKLKETIVNEVISLKAKSCIIGWNIANPIYNNYEDAFAPPFSSYYQQSYLNWLNEVVAAIKQVDPQRPVSCDLIADEHLITNADQFYTAVPQLDYLGLICMEDSPVDMVTALKRPYYFSKIDPQVYIQNIHLLGNTGAFMADWQNQQQWHYLTLNGLKDFEGRETDELKWLTAYWQGLKPAFQPLPDVKILRPAATIFTGDVLTYTALILRDKKWQLASELNTRLEFNWSLLKTDRYGNPTATQKAGKGTQLQLTVPDLPGQHRVSLTIAKAGRSKTVNSTLNTPLE